METLKIEIGGNVYFDIVPELDSFERNLMINISDDSLIQVVETTSEQIAMEENGEELLNNVPENAKWYKVIANSVGKIGIDIVYEETRKEVLIALTESLIKHDGSNSVPSDNALNDIATSQNIADGWS